MADARALTIQGGQMQELAIADSLLLSGIEIPDNTAAALSIAEGANVYALWDTTDGTEVLSLGNGGVNNRTEFLGSGEVTLNGAALVFAEQAGDPGGTANESKSYSKDVSGTTEAFVQDSSGNVVQITSGGNVNVGGGTDNISWDVNQDGVAGSDEDPFFIWTGGDGAAELIQTTLLQDSTADIMYLNTALAVDSPGDSDRDTELVLGPSTGAAASGDAINSRLVLRKHVAGDVVGLFFDTFVGYKSGNSAFQVHPEDSTAIADGGVSINIEGGYGAVAQGATPGAAGGSGFFLAGKGGNAIAGLAPGDGANCIVSSGDAGDFVDTGGGDSGDTIVNVGNPTGNGTAGNIELGFQAANIFIGGGSSTIAAFLDDDNSAAWRAVQGANNMVAIDTSNAAEGVSINNTTTNGFTDILGTGAMTVGGSVQLGTIGAPTFFASVDGVLAAVSGAAEGRIRYNDTTGTWQVSTQTSAYVDIATGAGSTPGGADTDVQFNDSGSFGGNSSFTYDGTNVTFANDIFADGGIERSGAGALTIGVTAAVTSIDIGVVGNMTTILGDFTVDGVSVFVSGTTFNDNAVFEGNTTFGDASTDRVLFGATLATGARIGTVASPDMPFTLEVNHRIFVDQSTTDNTVGASFTFASGIGADATGAGADAADGGAFTMGSGAGGDGNAADLAADGGVTTYGSGDGGLGTATVVGGDPGVVNVDTGAVGATGGAGAGSAVALNLGGVNAGVMNYGNANEDTPHNFLGTGAGTFFGQVLIPDGEVTVRGTTEVNLRGLTMTEGAGDPSTGADEFAIFVKDDGGSPQLFGRTESDGTVFQITPPASGGAATSIENAYTAGEDIAAGAPVIIVNDTGSPVLEEGDANVAARQRVFGVATAAILDLASGDITTFGPVPVPDAVWDVLPAVGDVGSPVYLSTTVGQLTITAPGGAVAIVDMGTVVAGGTGAVVVHVNVKLPVKTI